MNEGWGRVLEGRGEGAGAQEEPGRKGRVVGLREFLGMGSWGEARGPGGLLC